MATNHRGDELHAGKRTRDQYPRLTKAAARMLTREGDGVKGSFIPSSGYAVDLGENLIDQYQSTGDKRLKKKLQRVFKERDLPEREEKLTIFSEPKVDISRSYRPISSGETPTGGM